MGNLGNLPPREVLAQRGLRIPRTFLRQLRECGVQCQPAISKAGRVVLSGYESGGGVHELGAYCGYCSPDGGLMTWTFNLESELSRNGMHAIIVASDLVRIHVLRVADHLEILVTQHTLQTAEQFPTHNILLRARGQLQKTDKVQRPEEMDLSGIEFRDQNGSRLEIPHAFRSATLRVIQGALCVGCRHCHLLLPPAEAVDDVSQAGLKPALPSIDDVLADLATSAWMKNALLGALSRDAVDATNDAELLYRLLHARCDEILKADRDRLSTDNN